MRFLVFYTLPDFYIVNINLKWNANGIKANGSGRNGVGIVLYKDMKNMVTHMSRRSNRVMSVKIQLENIELNVISAYALQIGCEEEEKETFWRELEEEV